MSRIDVRITDEAVAHLAEGGSKYGPELLKLLDEEMAWFDRVMTGQVESSMRGTADKFERAAIKTFLYHKIVEGRKQRLSEEAADNKR